MLLKFKTETFHEFFAGPYFTVSSKLFIFNFHAVGMDSRVQTAVKSISWQILFLHEPHNFYLLSKNQFCAHFLTDTDENVQKWARVFSTRGWVILVARTRRKKENKIACPLLDVFAWGQVSSPRLYWLNQNFWKK